jgi:pyrroline-5-carboxylate reductase
MKIAFIGAGKMAEALISRLRKYQIFASDINRKRLLYLKKKYKIKVSTDNLKAFAFGEVVILAIKPQNFPEVMAELCQVKGKRKLIVSIAAGIPLRYLQKNFPGFPLVRAMPNNPCLVGAGITALARTRGVHDSEFGVVRKIFERVGEVVEVSEKRMDAVTGLSGSGPAFVYLMMEALSEGGERLGLPKKVAAELAQATILGAGQTAKQTKLPPKVLRAMVTSPGGTTIEGLKVLEKFKFKEALRQAVEAAARKSRKLSQLWAR